MNIWIMESDSGITLVYKPYMDFPVNEDLVSGLLTALNQFTIVEFKQGIDSIEMGGLRWVYIMDKETNLLFIGADTREVNGDILRSRLDVIRQTFIQEYANEKNKWGSNWAGNVEIYKPFEAIIDEYYSQWKQAERITTVAEFFDFIGIFQQILNLVINVIEAHLSDEEKQIIYNRIEELFRHYYRLEIVKKNPELSKISFTKNMGFNIINIDPMNSDMFLVEKQIINLIRNIVEILKKEVGYFNCLKYFIKENIFDYLLSNFSLLNDLNLFTFLLQLFLIE
ncbi:MAG: hypothetical protein ACFFEY_02505 [Candidatus Thorarchaeota archaeon]